MTFSENFRVKNINTLVLVLVVLSIFLCVDFTIAAVSKTKNPQTYKPSNSKRHNPKPASMDSNINVNSPSSESTDKESTDSFDELNQSNGSDITTKIYKSTDPSFELLDKQSDIDPASETDILSKEELISKKKNHKSGIIHRKKRIESQLIEEKKQTLMPWLLLILLVLVLGFIFKYLLQKKV